MKENKKHINRKMGKGHEKEISKGRHVNSLYSSSHTTDKGESLDATNTPAEELEAGINKLSWGRRA